MHRVDLERTEVILEEVAYVTILLYSIAVVLDKRTYSIFRLCIDIIARGAADQDRNKN